jgi:Nif-specific regulatory protein
MNGLDEQIKADVDEQCAVLESIMSVLMGMGPSAQKIEEAVQLIQQRLEMLRGRSGSSSEMGDAETSQWQGMPANRRRARSEGDAPSLGLVGGSPAMRLVQEAIARVSDSQATVLVRGESGTGKEVVARAIHLNGSRSKGPFVPLHCAAVSETLLESELFGHERGAFTGAVDSRKGRFESAEGGTLFLDEIGDIPPATQVKLLRVLQEKCFERVGGGRSISVDVRVISATHRDLEAMVRLGTFREDLYYRLNVVPITLPPLREREGDVPLLIDYFLSRVSRENRRQVRFGRDLLTLMMRYHWPGNVRELQNCVERLVVMANPVHDLITLETIPASLRGYFADMKQVTGGGEHARAGRERASCDDAQSLGANLQGIERDQLLNTLRRTGWIQARTARALGMTSRQVAYKMKKYGISEKEEN